MNLRIFYACVDRGAKIPNPVSAIFYNALCVRQDTLKTRKIGFLSTGLIPVTKVGHMFIGKGRPSTCGARLKFIEVDHDHPGHEI